jgi:hypothetical protein
VRKKEKEGARLCWMIVEGLPRIMIDSISIKNEELFSRSDKDSEKKFSRKLKNGNGNNDRNFNFSVGSTILRNRAERIFQKEDSWWFFAEKWKVEKESNPFSLFSIDIARKKMSQDSI